MVAGQSGTDGRLGGGRSSSTLALGTRLDEEGGTITASMAVSGCASSRLPRGSSSVPVLRGVT